jgi:tryptophan synthase alpha chain
MSRYEAMFKRLAAKNEGAFVPFVMLYDPNRELSKKIINTLVQAGADALELGIAFSDPLADGPTIQKAGLRAIRNKSTVHDALLLVKELRALHPDIPIGLLTYANLVFKNTLAWFYRTAHECGVDSVLIADVPLLEIEDYFHEAIKHNVDPVLIAPPNLPLERAKDIARFCRGYTYVVTRAGVTGANKNVTFAHRSLLKALKDADAPPALFGFGISAPLHVQEALREGASGVISGSKIVSIIEDNLSNELAMLSALKDYVISMKLATKR